MAIRAAVDIGGTFTDVVAFDDTHQRLLLGKTLSTPRDLIEGVFRGLAETGATEADLGLLIHGSTVVINALIERKGARAALLTTEGFRDVYEIGRINRPDSFNLNFTQHRPLIPREMVFEVPERLLADGTVLRELDEERVREIARRMVDLGVEAVAVVLLHAYKDPVHEVRVGEILREALPDAYVTLSHEISREYREFERTSTVSANAFVGPLVSDYLGRLEGKLRGRESSAGLAIMQSNGGVTDVSVARVQCVQMMESGPAGGVTGTIGLCESLGYQHAIAFDMGGTTAKAAVVRNLEFPQAPDYFVGGYASGLPIRIPCLDIVDVGTGGGSVAWIDEAGGMHVGPRSAGANPGPACYGLGGTEATITDAALLLGYLSPDGELAGGLVLDPDAARSALVALADELGLEVDAAAAGMLAIATSSMANVVRAVTTERGLDPRDFALVAYGGSGPLCISLVARELDMRKVVVPPVPALFSALGMLMADLRRDTVRTHVRALATTPMSDLEADFAELEDECGAGLAAEVIAFDNVRFVRALDMRYVGQEHTVTVTVAPDLTGPDAKHVLKHAFDEAHEQRFSHSAPGEPAELVSLRVSAIGAVMKPALINLEAGGSKPADSARIGMREVLFDRAVGRVDCPVYVRAALLAGNVVQGPALIEEPTATTVLHPGDQLVVSPEGSLVLTVGGLP